MIELELRRRWSALQNEMQLAGVDGCLMSVNVNIFYLTDQVYNGYFYLPSSGEPLHFIRRPAGLTGENILYIRKPEQLPGLLEEYGMTKPVKLMLELDELPYSEVLRLQAAFKVSSLFNATVAIRKIRSLKSEYELKLLRYSGALHALCYAEIPSLYQKGMTDVELSIEIERLFRRKGATGYFRVFGQSMEIFMGSVLAGKNAENASPYDFAMGGKGTHKSLPLSANGTVLTEGSAVMVDMGGTFTDYISDMTRVFSVGRLSDLAYKAHQTAINILNEIVNSAKPGVAAADLYAIALEMAKKEHLADYFMGYNQQAGFVGHGIGLQINESPVLAPRSRDVLQIGHVFAIEPKFVIPGVGAVGVENSYSVIESGLENLTTLTEDVMPLDK
jgi:Xaa-Pro dipeptidase